MSKPAIIVESPTKIRTLRRFVGGKYRLLASMGHVRDLPRDGLSVDVEDDFRPTYEVIPEKRKVLKDLKKQLEDVSEVYLATDPDREGEAIAWHLCEALELESPRRIQFNEITREAVLAALATPGEIDVRRVDAQQARRVLDRLVGYEVSPLLQRRLKKRDLSAGRVQSVALRLICDRERKIAAFVPEESWTVE
ncbi:MAG: type IA DNA topoisomerase, partial [Armatimonadota bacterium]